MDSLRALLTTKRRKYQEHGYNLGTFRFDPLSSLSLLFIPSPHFVHEMEKRILLP